MKINKQPVFLIALLFLQINFLFAQKDSTDYIISHRTLSVEDGMASREVFCGLQDNDGFLWFGTRNGLNRYDGKLFQLFTKQKNGLKDNTVIQLAKDNNNHLFIVYGQRGYQRKYTAMDVMDLTTHKIETLDAVFPHLPFDSKNIYWITNDGDDICFLVSKPYQYWRLSKKGFELKCEMTVWDTTQTKPFPEIEFQSSWYYLFRGDNAILSMDNMNYTYIINRTKIEVIENKEYRIAGISPEKNILWFKYNYNDGRYVTFFKRDKKGVFSSFDFEGLQAEDFHRMYIVQSSNLYDIGIYTPTKGLLLYNHQSLQKLSEAVTFKGYENFFSLFTDNQGNKWFCTPSGVIEVKLEKNRFAHYFTKAQTGNQGNNQVRGIYADSKGKVYANVWEKFCTSNGTNFNTGIFYACARFRDKFYSGEKLLVEYNEKNNTFSPPLFRNGNDVKGELCTIDSLSPNELLLGFARSIEKYNVETQSVSATQYPSEDFPVAKFVYRFIKRKDNKIWAIAENGLFLLDKTATNVIDYWGRESNDKSRQLPFDRMHDAVLATDDIFWMATNGEGLYRWDMNKKDFRQFNITAGFPSDILYRMEEDNEHNLWISTDNGLVRFNTKNFKVSAYTTKEGISHNEFNRISSFKAKDGRLYFGGLDGVNAFYPKDFLNDTSTTNAPLRIISYSQFSGEQDELIDQTTQLQKENKIVLQPGDRFFNLEFRLLDFEEGKSSYTYKIDGIDKDWNFLNQNSIRLGGMPYGNYTLRIRGQSQVGRRSINELVIPIEVVTPLVKKLGFQLFLFFLISALVLFITKYRTANLKRNSELLAATVDKRTQQLRQTIGERDVLLKEIHHRVKNNLQVIVSLLSMHQKNIDSPALMQSFTEAKTNVRSISLIHENLYQHDSLAGVDMKSFAGDLFRLINDLFNPYKEKVNFVNNINDIELDIETAVPLGLILNELLTNSFKYALEKNKEMHITLDIKEDKQKENYLLIYTDNGSGLPKDFDLNKTKTMGMTLMKDLCRQTGGSFQYHFDNGSCFSIPFLSMKGRKQTD